MLLKTPSTIDIAIVCSLYILSRKPAPGAGFDSACLITQASKDILAAMKASKLPINISTDYRHHHTLDSQSRVKKATATATATATKLKKATATATATKLKKATATATATATKLKKATATRLVDGSASGAALRSKRRVRSTVEHAIGDKVRAVYAGTEYEGLIESVSNKFNPPRYEVFFPCDGSIDYFEAGKGWASATDTGTGSSSRPSKRGKSGI
jgi:hypothetical protein